MHLQFHPLTAERRSDVLDQLSKASSPGFDYFLMTVLSCTIATFGLITNSAAVIIGAMLVAPLMSPILGLSLASVAGERRVFQAAALAVFEGALLSIALSALLGWFAQQLPFGVLTNLPAEILSRTRPTPFDLMIGLAGGAAAAYALAQPELSAALPGVAIATALMPPLCTIGIGISLQSPSVYLGALLLFLTNLVAISFAGILFFALMGFRPTLIIGQEHMISRSVIVSAILVLLITIPLVILSIRFVNDAQVNQTIQTTVLSELAAFPNAQLVGIDTKSVELRPANPGHGAHLPATHVPGSRRVAKGGGYPLAADGGPATDRGAYHQPQPARPSHLYPHRDAHRHAHTHQHRDSHAHAYRYGHACPHRYAHAHGYAHPHRYTYLDPYAALGHPLIRFSESDEACLKKFPILPDPTGSHAWLFALPSGSTAPTWAGCWGTVSSS